MVRPFSLRVAPLTAGENACGAEGFVTPVKLIEKDAPPRKTPDRIEIVINDPYMDTAPDLAGVPRGENTTGAPSLQLNEPGSVTIIFPLTGIGLAGVNEIVIEIPLPPRAGFESVIAGDNGPKESARTSHASI
jgi:hypothetical protein